MVYTLTGVHLWGSFGCRPKGVISGVCTSTGGFISRGLQFGFFFSGGLISRGYSPRTFKNTTWGNWSQRADDFLAQIVLAAAGATSTMAHRVRVRLGLGFVDIRVRVRISVSVR